MLRYEYRVVPAPEQGKKGKGVKGTAGRFAHALETLMNEMGAEGWDYLRCDTLPCEERTGLTGRTTTFQNMLVFRRPLPDAAEARPDGAARALPPLAPPEETGTADDAPEAPAAARATPRAADAAAAAAAALVARRGRNGSEDGEGVAAE